VTPLPMTIKQQHDPGGGYLHKPQLIADAVIVVDVVSNPLVKRLGRVDVVDRHSDDLKP
jgi:hypothetical protein